MDRIAKELRIDVVDLAIKNISPYDYEHRNRADDFEPLMKRVLESDQVIFATPVYWYAVSPPMKVFLDRIADFLDLPDLQDQGRSLRGKTAYIVCTSVYEEVPASFLASFEDTLGYLGIRLCGVAHANCRDGYDATKHDTEAARFARLVESKRKPK
jgi:multimeric flavodoxin WrbA